MRVFRRIGQFMSKYLRKDGERITDLDGFHSMVPYIMPKRTEAEVSSNEFFDVTDLISFLKEENEQTGSNFKLFHAVCTAVARTVYLRPKMNVFIAGRRFWQRKDITLSFVAKQKYEDTAEETLMFLKVTPEMTLKEISSLILGDVDKARKSGSNDLGKTMEFVGKLPRFLLEILFFVLRRLEYHGIMPSSLTAGDPNYSTVLLSNLGSIKAGAPYHHLSNYGTCSIMITIGTLHPEHVITSDGQDEIRQILPMTFTIDERIADGFYFARSLKLTKYMLEHPNSLLERIDAPLPESIF